MAWARFTKQYEHRWPSRAISVYKPDRGLDGKGLYQVKAEVLKAALAAGRATEARAPGGPVRAGKTDMVGNGDREAFMPQQDTPRPKRTRRARTTDPA